MKENSHARFIPIRCPVCNGRGTVNWGKEICHACKGQGYIIIDQETGKEVGGENVQTPRE